MPRKKYQTPIATVQPPRPRRRTATRAAVAEPTAVQPPPPPAGPGPKGKLGLVVALMRRPQGATIADMMDATAWQAHSVRGALAGVLKKKHGFSVASNPAEQGRVYRIVEPTR
jgi:hypothetical protein